MIHTQLVSQHVADEEINTYFHIIEVKHVNILLFSHGVKRILKLNYTFVVDKILCTSLIKSFSSPVSDKTAEIKCFCKLGFFLFTRFQQVPCAFKLKRGVQEMGTTWLSLV